MDFVQNMLDQFFYGNYSRRDYREIIFIFRNEKFSQVEERLGRSCNTGIALENEGSFSFKSKDTLDNEILNEVLKIIAIAASIIWEELRRNLTKTSLYKRRRILIQLDEGRMDSFQ